MIFQTNDSVRQQRELNTAKAMIRLYCKTLHRGAIVCPECEGLIQYIEDRMWQCRMGNEKPHCLRCQSPCYQPAKRLQLSHVLRWAMPKFAWRNPLQAIKFKFDLFRSHDGENNSTSTTQ
ncbi:hypothetical protein ABT56_16775 [Photobacterium aquae]|uniref:Nitrous oxide-stimulated promoter n=1 Tax=Photobacterium aquae TaxID=1195763 RepID=A0A0J1GW97_9GAMM|nr:nitrous oxide-stimulated promoter family protein [Photobacterium aquae]KLV03983.1 hypothetical protein ABT56_16775 [Photobacterium aquae]